MPAGYVGATAWMNLRANPALLRRDIEAGARSANVAPAGRAAGRAYGGAFGGSFRSVLAGAGLTAGVFGAAAMVRASTEFSASMTRIRTQTGATAADVKVLTGQVMALGRSSQYGPGQLADSLYHLKSVGMDNTSAMRALATATDLAAVGGADLEQTTNALAGAWRSGIRGAQDFSEAAATVNAIVGAGNMRMGDLVGAISTGLLPVARTFGLEFKDVGSSLALLTDMGMPAAEAATRLRMSLSLLGAPSAIADARLKSIGLTGLDLANAMRQPQGIITALTLLKQHLDASGLSAAQQSQLLSRAFGGGRSSAAILALLGHLDVLQRKQDQITASMGKYGSAVEAQRKTAGAAFNYLRALLETLAVQAASVVLPALAAVARAFTGAGAGSAALRWSVLALVGSFAALKVIAWVTGALRALRVSYVLATVAAQAHTTATLLLSSSAAKLTTTTRVLAIAMRVFSSPAGIVAGIAAIGAALVYAAVQGAKARTEFEKWQAVQHAHAQKAGYDSKTWDRYVSQLREMTAGQARVTRSQAEMSAGARFAAAGWERHVRLLHDQTAALQQASRESANYDRAIATIAGTFGIATPEAVKLAQAAGTQARQFGAGGREAQKALEKVIAYGQANQTAHPPARQFATDLETIADNARSATDRVKALRDMYDTFIDPQVKADRAAIGMANSLAELRRNLRASRGQMNLQTQANRDSLGSWGDATQAAWDLAQQVLSGNDTNHRYRNYLHNVVIPSLYAAAGADKTRRKEVDRLHRALDAMRDPPPVKITVTAQGGWSVVGVGKFAGKVTGLPGGARGLYVTQGTTPTADDVLARVSRRELIVPASIVDAGEVDHLRGRIPGFGAGGRPAGAPVPAGLWAKLAAATPGYARGRYAGGPGTMHPWLDEQLAETKAAITRSVVAGIRRSLEAAAARAAAAPGGPGSSAIVKDAMQWLGRIPYVWGGTAVPGGADCSGFVMTIYGRHGIAAPRTSEAQGAWVRRTGPTPGGLAFYDSPAGGPPPGHVAIVGYGGKVISQGGGMGPQLENLRFAPLMWTGVPPGGLGARPRGPGPFAGKVRSYDAGGQIRERILGVGMSTGQRYGFHAGEEVTPGAAGLARRLDRLIAAVGRLAAETARAQARTGGALAETLNRTGRRAAYSGYR